MKLSYLNTIMFAVLTTLFTMATPVTSIAATTVLGTCTIITPSASTTISSSGFYCLNANSNLNLATGRAVTINASNVVLDLNGFTMTNTNGSNQAIAIGSTADPSNVTIRNGKIVGYKDGITLQPATGGKYIIEGMSVDAIETGMDIEADNTIIRNNAVHGGSRGVIVCKNDVRIQNNQIAGDGGGIDSCSDSVRIFIEGNSIVNPTANGGNGIYLGEYGHAVVNNRLANWTVGIAGYPGTAKYRDNLFIDVITNAEGITDAGNNN